MLSFVLVDNWIIKLIGLAMLAARFYSIMQMRAVWYSVWRTFAAIFSLMFALAVRRPEEDASRHSDKNPGDSNAVLQ